MSNRKAKAKKARTFMLTHHYRRHQAGETFTRAKLRAMGCDPSKPPKPRGPIVVPADGDGRPMPLGEATEPIETRELSLERTGSAKPRKIGEFAW